MDKLDVSTLITALFEKLSFTEKKVHELCREVYELKKTCNLIESSSETINELRDRVDTLDTTVTLHSDVLHNSGTTHYLLSLLSQAQVSVDVSEPLVKEVIIKDLPLAMKHYLSSRLDLHYRNEFVIIDDTDFLHTQIHVIKLLRFDFETSDLTFLGGVCYEQKKNPKIYDELKDDIQTYYNKNISFGENYTYLTSEGTYTSTYDFVMKFAKCSQIPLSEADLIRPELDQGKVYCLNLGSNRILNFQRVCRRIQDNSGFFKREETEKKWSMMI